jgi:hypothetical protein
MKSAQKIKTRFTSAAAWLVEDPRHVQLVLLGLAVVAIVALAVTGLATSGVQIAGNAPGGGGGSG